MKSNFLFELKKAKKNHYAVPGFNFDNLMMVKAIVEAAEELSSPVILMATESAISFMGLEYTIAIAKEAIKKASVPLIFHLDHGMSVNIAKRLIDLEIDSIMLDWSNKPVGENISATKVLCDYAHARNVYVESEIGHVGGKEDNRNSDQSWYTEPKAVVEFIKDTDVDALAISVGTSHGIYKHKVDLQFDLIKKIAGMVKQPLVLHGCSGVPDDQLKKAIKAGISKVNIGTDLKVANTRATYDWMRANPEGYDARKYGRDGIEAMKKIVKQKILVCMSNNHA